MFCSKCGSEMSEGAKFCPKCGAAVAEVTPSGNGSVPSSGSVQQAAPPQGTATSGGGIKGVWQCFLNVAKTYWSSFICGSPAERKAYWNSRMGLKDFWSFYLFVALCSIVYVCLMATVGCISDALAYLFVVPMYFVLLPMSVTMSARRMHDSGKSFWFVFIPVYGYVLYLVHGTAGENKFGPKNEGDDGVIKNRKPSQLFIIAGAVAAVLSLIVAIGSAVTSDWSDGYSSSSYSSSDSSSSDSYVESVLNDTEEFVTKFEKTWKKGDMARMKQLANSGEATAIAMQIEVLNDDDLTPSQRKRWEKIIARLNKIMQEASAY